jgi:hypothetical protein
METKHDEIHVRLWHEHDARTTDREMKKESGIHE